MAAVGLAAALAGGVWFGALVVAVCGGILWECWQITAGPKRDMRLLAVLVVWILLAGWGLIEIRLTHGLVALLWLVLVVIASDVAGYFAGKSLGGPKFWPAISPKKTWSGTVAGWAAAGGVGACVALLTATGWVAVPLSILTAFAGQMGDIAESAVKRRFGVKDSSDLITGHGGLFDRFDALLGATLFLVVMSFLFGDPTL